MATNWVKDGLDAYLSLTGEKRAQDKADSDKAYQAQQMTLAQNADTRAAESANLSNQAAGLQIDKLTRDKKETDEAPLRFANYFKLKQRSVIPGLEDVKGIAATESEANDLIVTGSILKKMPAGRIPLQVPDLPAEAQRTLMNGPYIAAQQRKGQKHTDAQGEYTMTGELGTIFVESAGEGADAVVVPTMKAMRTDGTIIEVPYTAGRSNKGDDPITAVSAQQMMTRGASTLTAIKNAREKGTHPADESADLAYQMMAATMTPAEMQKWMADDRAKSQARAETTQYDESVAKAAAPYLALVSKLKGTAAEKEALFLDAIKGAPKSVVAYLKDNVEVSNKLFEPEAKRESAAYEKQQDREQRERESKRHADTMRAGFANRDSNKSNDPMKDMKASEKLIYDRAAKRIESLAKQYENATDDARPAIDAEMSSEKKKMDKVIVAIAKRNGEAIPQEVAGESFSGDGIQSPIPPKGQQPKPSANNPETSNGLTSGMTQQGNKTTKQAPLTATNKATGQRLQSTDGGKSWKPVK